jgi:hypothetical protein
LDHATKGGDGADLFPDEVIDLFEQLLWRVSRQRVIAWSA